MKTLSLSLLLSTALLFGAQNEVSAQSYYTSGHADIGLGFEDGAFVPHWHLGAGSVVNGVVLQDEAEYAPEDLRAVFVNTRGAASNADNYLGVAPGTTIYMGGPSSTWQPNLGFGTEELDPGDWSGPITITMSGWTTPEGGNFALYTTNAAGTITSDIFLSTFNPSSANIDGIGANSFNIPPGSHEHYTFGFTTPGYYEITLNYSGTHLGELVTGSGTFGFEVVPEPSTYALLALSVVGWILFMRKRRAQA